MIEKLDLPEADRQSIQQRALKYVELRRQPYHHFADLREVDVPETIGVYIIYDSSESNLPMYVGKAQKAETKQSGNPAGLRFRIMRNHLGKAGNDNFLHYLAEHIGGDKKQAVEYVKHHCSCQWITLKHSREAFLLEHFAISLLDPFLNRG